MVGIFRSGTVWVQGGGQDTFPDTVVRGWRPTTTTGTGTGTGPGTGTGTGTGGGAPIL